MYENGAAAAPVHVVVRPTAKELLPEARLKGERQAEINSLASTRDKLVKLRTTLINKLHALHRERGLESRKRQFLSARGMQAVLE